MQIETGTTGIHMSKEILTTETYDVATLQQQRDWFNRINEVLLGVIERDITPESLVGRNITPESLKRMAHTYDLLKPHPPMNKAELINEEREENIRTYTEYKAKLYEEYMGRYVVIAKGDIQAVGESFDDIKNVALDANHRFIFKVESKKKVRGRFRWPMKRK